MKRLFAVAFLAAAPSGAADFPDREPQPMRAVYKPADRVKLFADVKRDRRERPCPPLSAADFASVEGGRLVPAARYDLSKLDAHDRALLDHSLAAAYKYADVNKAYADGYRLEDFWATGMGLHAMNLDLVMSETFDPAKPQFMTYTLSKAGTYQLMQVGYIRRRQRSEGPFPLFHAPEAVGHFHGEDWCVRVEDGVFKGIQNECGEKDVRVGPIWMMHVTPNLFVQEGIFADFFSCANHLSRTDKQYTFFGKPFPPKK